LNRTFRFKQFSVDDSGAAMKVGTDAVLLGCLCEAENPAHALDIGTGSGVIALQLAQRFPNCQVDAVELDEAAALQAKTNFQASPWPARLQIFQADVRHWQEKQSYDLVVCNPPFYPHSFPAQGVMRQQAREQQSLNYEDLAQVMASCLNTTGSCWCVLPTNFEGHWMQALASARLKAFSHTYIQGVSHKTANRVVVGAARVERAVESRQLVIRDAAGNYTADYLRLTKDFYLFA